VLFECGDDALQGRVTGVEVQADASDALAIEQDALNAAGVPYAPLADPSTFVTLDPREDDKANVFLVFSLYRVSSTDLSEVPEVQPL
jgi:hypothetical protein